MATSSLNRLTGRNCHVTISGQNIDGSAVSALNDLVSGFLDRIQGTFTPTYNTYNPLGQTTEHDQATSGYWEMTMTGGDRESILFALTSIQEAARQNKRPIPLLKMTVVGYDPDAGDKVINWTFGQGTIRQGTFDMNGLNNALTNDVQVRFRTFSRG